VVSDAKKAIGSRPAMRLSAKTSPYYDTWVKTAAADVDVARTAVLNRDLETLGRVMEQSTHKMHATMTTSTPPVFYAQPGTIACIHAVMALRNAGTSAWLTMDAGPNVKVLCATADADRVQAALAPHAAVVHCLGPGGAPVRS
jgi:diphosphomevalonate decarboxylase